MLGQVKGTSFKWSFTSAVVAFTPGATNAEGAWQEIISDVDVTSPIWGFDVYISNGATSAAIKDHLLDIGIDVAGGTTYVALISNMVCGNSGNRAIGGIRYRFPLKIPSGAAIAARVQGSNGTAGTISVQIVVWGKPHRPELAPHGQYVETIGTITNSGGVAFTPSNGAWGAYQLIGTTAKDLWWWQVCAQVSDATQSALQTMIELSVGDATNKHVIIPHSRWVSSAAEERFHPVDLLAYRFVPGGTNVYVRAWSFGNPDSAHNAVVVGVGG